MYSMKKMDIDCTKNDFYDLMEKVSVSINDRIEDVVKKSALNTYKKYLVYWNEVTPEHKIYTHFELYDSDEKFHDGFLIDLDEVRKLLKENDK